MKNLLLLFAFFVISAEAFSQACVIDTNNYQLLSPPSDQLPCIVRDSAYDLTLQLFCPPSLGGISIDSIKVSTFPGLPSGITKTSNPTNGIMHPLERMCIHLSGTTTDTVGYYEILYNGTAYTSAGNAPFSYLRTNFPGTLPDYGLNVINAGETCPNTPDTVSTGISKLNTPRAAFSVYPNPSNGVFTFALNAEQKLNGEITVTDVTGKTVYAQFTQAAPVYQTSIDLSRFAKGIYFVRYRTPLATKSKKIAVE